MHFLLDNGSVVIHSALGASPPDTITVQGKFPGASLLSTQHYRMQSWISLHGPITLHFISSTMVVLYGVATHVKQLCLQPRLGQAGQR